MSDSGKIYDDLRELHREFTDPFRQLTNHSDTQATDMAKLVLQSLILIHGGALAGLPAFRAAISNLQGWGGWFPLLQSSQTCPDRAAFAFHVMMGSCALGLITAILGGALGFHSLANRADSYNQFTTEQSQRAFAHARWKNPEAVLSVEQEKYYAGAIGRADAARAQAQLLFGRFQTQRALAICSTWASFVFLLLAAGAGALAF